jgi:GNAT superfamily N-acetyltransferase
LLLAVDKNKERKGLGRSLVAYVHECARAAGSERLIVLSNGHKFWRHPGLRFVDLEPNHGHNVFVPWNAGIKLLVRCIEADEAVVVMEEDGRRVEAAEAAAAEAPAAEAPAAEVAADTAAAEMPAAKKARVAVKAAATPKGPKAQVPSESTMRRTTETTTARATTETTETRMEKN